MIWGHTWVQIHQFFLTGKEKENTHDLHLIWISKMKVKSMDLNHEEAMK